MTRFLFIVSVFALFITCTQCKKDEQVNNVQKAISYSFSGWNGVNILYMMDTIYIDNAIMGAGIVNSFSADLGKDATLKVVMHNLSTDPNAIWGYQAGSELGWYISTYNDDDMKQEFNTIKTGHLDLKMMFFFSGRCRIEYFENNSTIPTRTKFIDWQ